MAKWFCKCGQVLRDSGDIPNPAIYHLISDVDYENYTGQIDAEELYADFTRIIKCSACNRLEIYWNGRDKEPAVYCQENMPEAAPAPTQDSPKPVRENVASCELQYGRRK